MERQAFTEKSLNQILKHYRIKKNIQLNESDASTIVQSALQMIERSEFEELSMCSFNKKNIQVFCLQDEKSKIIERKIVLNLRQVFNIHTDSRNSIVRKLKLILCETVPYKVYRLDVKNFFESFQQKDIENTIFNNINLSPQTKKILRILLDIHKFQDGEGCPRGLAISSVIAEILMKNFDINIKNQPNCFFYARYVDDIIIITTISEAENEEKNNQEFLKELAKFLPSGLEFNKKKFQTITLSNDSQGNKDESKSFDFLGYKFIIDNLVNKKKQFRKISIDLADNKYKKYKFKLFRTFYDFKKNKDWTLLEERIKFLTSNFEIEKLGSRKKFSGIYYNYTEITEDKFLNGNLKKLDKLLRALLLKKFENDRFTQLIYPILNQSEKRENKKKLLKYSFVRGYKNKIIIIPKLRITFIKKCWEN